MKIIVTEANQNIQFKKEDAQGNNVLNTDLNAQTQQQKRQSIRNTTLKLFNKNVESSNQNGNNKGINDQNNFTSAIGGQKVSSQTNISNNQTQQPSKTVSIMSRLFQKQTNLRPSKVNFDDNKNKVNYIQKSASLKRFDYTPESIIGDPLLNEFPEGMPRKHFLYKELLQAYFNGDISMNELIDLRNKYSMRKQKLVSLPLKDEDHLQSDKKGSQANFRLWQQIRSLRQKQLVKSKQNEKRVQRNSIILAQTALSGLLPMRRESLQSIPQSQNSISQATINRVDTKGEIMSQIDEKDENNKNDEEQINEEDLNTQTTQSRSAPSGNIRKMNKFGSIIFDKLLNIKDKSEHKKVLEMKQNKSSQNHFLSQFEEAQQEVIEKIKRGDLLQNDLSHKYYVKQFIERKNLNHLNIFADKTAQIESSVAQKTLKKINEDFKANKNQIYKDLEDAADEYLHKIQLKKLLIDKYSNHNTDKCDEMEQLKSWRQLNAKKILKEQKERHMNQYYFEKEQKDLEEELKKQRLIKSRLTRNSVDSISQIQSKQENSTSVENIRNNYYNSSKKLQTQNSTNLKNNYFNSSQQQYIGGQTLKQEKNTPSVSAHQKNNNQLQSNGGTMNNLNKKNNQFSQIQNQNTNSIHASRTSMSETTPVLIQSARKNSQYLQNLSNSKTTKHSTPSSENLYRKTTDGIILNGKSNQNQNQQKFVEDYLLNGTNSSSTSNSNSNKLNLILQHQKNKGLHHSQNNSTSIPFIPKTVEFDLNKNNNNNTNSHQVLQNKRKIQINSINDSLSKSAFDQNTQQIDNEETKENQKKSIQYLSNSKIINEHNKQNKSSTFLKDIYDLYSQEELYRNNNELRMRSKMHVSDKENLNKFYKSEYEYKIIKRNANALSCDRQVSTSKLDIDRSISTQPGNYEYKQRVKSESNCLNGLLNTKPNHHAHSMSNNSNINNAIETDTFVENTNQNNNNCQEDSESGDSSLPSITEAQLDSLYSQSRHIQKMILKSKGNTQMFARRMKNVIKLKEINEGINKCIKMKLNHKSINS